MAELAAVDRIDGEWVIAIGSAAEFTVHRVREREALEQRLNGAPTVVVTAEAQAEFTSATGRTSDLEAISRLEAVYRSVRKEEVAGRPCLVLFLEESEGLIGLVEEGVLQSKHAADPALTPWALFQECAKRSPSFAYWLRLKKDNQPALEKEAFRSFLDNLLSGDAAKPVGATRWMRRTMRLDEALSRDAFRRMRTEADPRGRARLLVLAGWAGAAHWDLDSLLRSEDLEVLARSGKSAFECGPRGLVEYAKETMKPPVDTARLRAGLALLREALVMKAGVAVGEVIPQLAQEVRPRHRKTVAEYLALREEAGQLEKRLGLTPVPQTWESDLKALAKRVEDLAGRHQPDTFFEALDAGHACGAAARGDLLKALSIRDFTIAEGTPVSDPAKFEVIGEAQKGPLLEIEKMVAPGYTDAAGRVIRKPRVVVRAAGPAVITKPVPPPKPVKRNWPRWWKPSVAALAAGGVVFAAIFLWRMAGRSEPSRPRELELGAKVLKTSLAAGGGSLLTVLEGNQARLLEVRRTADWSRVSAALASASPAAAISPDGSLLATGSEDRGLPALWNSKAGSPIGKMEPATARHDDTIRTLVFSPHGSYLISGADDGVAKLWNVRTRRFLRELPLHSPVTALAVGPKGLIAAGIWDKGVSVWEQEASRISQILQGAPDRITDVTVSPDESQVAAASVDQVLLWRLNSGGQKPVVKQLNANVTGVAFSPDGRLLAAAAGNSIWIWDLSGGEMKPRKPLNAHSAPVTSLVFLPGLSPLSLVSGSEDKSLKIWEIP